MKKTFLISTGGSGGHITPATIIGDHLSDIAKIIISSDKRGMKYLDERKYDVKVINTPKLNNFLLLPFNLIIIFFLILKSISFILKFKVNKLISTGGYMSLPLLFAARILRVEIFLIEPNQVLGRTNKLFLGSCSKIICYSKKIKNFPQKFSSKIYLINPLVKKEIYNFNLKNNSEKIFNLLIVGGSQGAKIFDENLKYYIKNISHKIPLKIFHQTNERNILILQNFYKEHNVDNEVFTYEKNFTNILTQTNLSITRAGASTLAELSVLNIPFIAVPLATSKDNHQFENANFYKERNCCWLLEQNLFESKIEELLNNIILNKLEYLDKKDNLKKLNYQNTWINVNQKILRIFNENRTS